MPKRTTDYGNIQSDANAHREYISTALSLFATGSINYDDYDIAYVVAAKAPKDSGVLFNSPTLSAGIDVPTNNGTVRHAVTFGRDSYERGSHVLLHETGHLFGLPDLYLFATQPIGLNRLERGTLCATSTWASTFSVGTSTSSAGSTSRSFSTLSPARFHCC